MTLLQVRNLVTTFHTADGPVEAVRDVSFDLNAGETLALVGESGSGKSVTALSLLNMVRRPGRVEQGQVLLEGRDLLTLGEAELREVRGGELSMIFQDPVSSLNPLLKVRAQLTEAVLAHRRMTRRAAEERAVELMTRVGIPDPEARLADYPLAFSGGMAQRVMIAMALAGEPKVIIADEPTTALDVTIQAQILELLAELNRENGTAVILITHNLGIVARLCRRRGNDRADLRGSPPRVHKGPSRRDSVAASPASGAAGAGRARAFARGARSGQGLCRTR
jgi:peptide/nickel transport system ATP-binding protein